MAIVGEGGGHARRLGHGKPPQEPPVETQDQPEPPVPEEPPVGPHIPPPAEP